MKFVNESKDHLKFKFPGNDGGLVTVECAPGATVDIADEYANAMGSLAPQLKVQRANPPDASSSEAKTSVAPPAFKAK